MNASHRATHQRIGNAVGARFHMTGELIDKRRIAVNGDEQVELLVRRAAAMTRRRRAMLLIFRRS